MNKVLKIIFAIIESIVLICDIINYIKERKTFFISIALLIAFFVLYILDVLLKRRKNSLNIPDNIKFIIEFIDDVGYSKRTILRKLKDNGHEITDINKVYTINATSCNTVKTYKGIVSDKLSDGLMIMTCGGSSTSAKDIAISTYVCKSRFIKTKYTILQENERVKIIKLPFNDNISTGNPFNVKYVEKDWSGSMRNDYDGLVVAEHLLFKKVQKQHVKVVFKRGTISNIDVYSYNIINHEIIKLDNVIIKESDLVYHWEHVTEKADRNIIYFILYIYKEPLQS